MKHDDVVGEAVCEAEALEAQKWATAGIIGQDLDDLEKWVNPDGSWRFAGSQPVSHALLHFMEFPFLQSKGNLGHCGRCSKYLSLVLMQMFVFFSPILLCLNVCGLLPCRLMWGERLKRAHAAIGICRVAAINVSWAAADWT